MDWSIPIGCVLIFLARIADVSLGTLRTVAVINGRRATAWWLGFFEVLVWVAAVSHVIRTIDAEHWYFAVAYALGFATGNYIGITIEQRVAFGDQVVRVFTRRAAEMVPALRAEGRKVTEFDGRGRDGPVAMLFIETRRKDAQRIAARARHLDPNCYFVVDDIRMTSAAMVRPIIGGEPTGWRSVFKKK